MTSLHDPSMVLRREHSCEGCPYSPHEIICPANSPRRRLSGFTQKRQLNGVTVHLCLTPDAPEPTRAELIAVASGLVGTVAR
jgi:hypothetical protein